MSRRLGIFVMARHLARRRKRQESQNLFEVETVLNIRPGIEGNEYLIKWLDYPEEDNTWEHESLLMCPQKIAEFHARPVSAKIVLRRKSVLSPYSMAGKQPREHSVPQPVVKAEEASNRSHDLQIMAPLRAGQQLFVAVFMRAVREENVSRRADPAVIGVYPSEEDAWKAAYLYALDQALLPANPMEERYAAYAERTAGTGNFRRRAQELAAMLSNEPFYLSDTPSRLVDVTVDVCRLPWNEMPVSHLVTHERSATLRPDADVYQPLQIQPSHSGIYSL